jgi:pyruvate/2-oxoglutarate dehydrogenase complex dihydrolipoamide dehydrogenase (E3) component
VDTELRTTNPNVWALGDCNGKGAFTHTAYNDYEIVADNLLANAGRKWTDRILGAALLGTSADESVHSLIDAVYSRLPYPEFQRRVRIHPNVSELLPFVLEDLKPL